MTHSQCVKNIPKVLKNTFVKLCCKKNSIPGVDHYQTVLKYTI